MINPYYFTDRVLQVGLNITLESNYIIHADSKLPFKPNYLEIGIKGLYFNKILKKILFFMQD